LNETCIPFHRINWVLNFRVCNACICPINCLLSNCKVQFSRGRGSFFFFLRGLFLFLFKFSDFCFFFANFLIFCFFFCLLAEIEINHELLLHCSNRSYLLRRVRILVAGPSGSGTGVGGMGCWLASSWIAWTCSSPADVCVGVLQLRELELAGRDVGLPLSGSPGRAAHQPMFALASLAWALLLLRLHQALSH